MFFSTWFALLRILVVGVCAYGVLVLLLRASGKRTLSKLNAFDLVVTVALGSSLSSAILTKNTALLDGVAAFALLIGLQFVVTWASVRSRTLGRLVKAEPTLLFYHGTMLHDAMRRERVTEAEVLQAIRAHGIGALQDVEAVVLETGADLSVLRRSGETTSLQDVAGIPGRSPNAG